MRKIALFLILGMLLSCTLWGPTNSSPEEFFAAKKPLSLTDLRVMNHAGFDFTQLSSSGISYLQTILTTPSPETKDFLRVLLSEKMISPTWRNKEGQTLLSLVLLNPSAVALNLVEELLSSSFKEFYLTSGRNPLLDALQNSNAVIRDQLINRLLSEGISLTASSAFSGDIPILRFLSLYGGEDEALFQKILKHLRPSLQDQEGNGVWHYLFLNHTSTLEKVTDLWLKNSLYSSLLTRKNKKNEPPLFILARNSQAPDVAKVSQKLRPFYLHEFQNPTFVGHLLLNVLQNTGNALKPLFLSLLSIPMDINVQDDEGRNSFLIALQNPRSEILPILGYLINSHVNVAQVSKDGEGYLAYSLRNTGQDLKNILNFLEHQGLPFSEIDTRGYDAVNYIVQNKGPYASSILEYLIARGLNVLNPNQDGQTALERVFSNENPQALTMLRTLIYSSYQGKANEPYSQNVIFSAAQAHGPHANKMLLTILQQGFNPYTIDSKRQNALFYAIQNTGAKAPSMVRLLSMKGVPLQTSDAKGNNLFFYAVQNPVYRFVFGDLLLGWDVDINRRNEDGKSALDEILSQDAKSQKRWKEVLLSHHLLLQNKTLVPLPATMRVQNRGDRR